ncbi:hypothetical protein M413DRAFT_444608 [Hebeloma cylindrosporum]|uniref:F-box domain-containing protein n=1 Tax=Hebeloma cylindrosporum TaxID=76867 RepID=A0A0C3BZX3_HEBCY|nr:hypothetical protein M413DRAFT_444608 [Hebeloma cylindrosporum h7]
MTPPLPVVRQPMINFDSPAWSDINLLPVQFLRKPLNVLDAHWRQYPIAVAATFTRAYRWLRRRQSKFESLPSETLVEIFLHLGWRDILLSREVCKRLFEISKSRPIWLSLLHQCSMILPRPPTLDRSVDLYTTQELEDLVVSRISAEVAWRSRKDPRYREIALPNGFGEADIVLVDGGRWLLALSELQVHYGCILAYDLDAPEIQEPAVIVRPQDAWDAQRAFFMAVDMDKNEPTLTFNVCIMPEKYGGPGDVFETLLGEREEVPIPILQVYQVRQLEHGSKAKLVSRRLHSFPLPMHGETRGISLRGPHFARMFRSLNGHDRIEVYEWTKCEASTHVKASILYADHWPIGVSILPDFKLLVIRRCDMAVYNIQQLISISIPETEDDQIVTLDPYFTTTLKDRGLHPLFATFSRPHIDTRTTRVAVTLKQGIYGLIIPRNGDSPRVTMISNDKIFGEHICIGINRLFSQSGLTTWAASYTWPDDDALGLDGELRRPLPFHERRRDYGQICQFPALMDEETGRVVNGFEGGLAVLDWM